MDPVLRRGRGRRTIPEHVFDGQDSGVTAFTYDERMASPAGIDALVVDGWANYQRLLCDRIRRLSREELAFRTAPAMWAIWQLAGHLAGTRAYWFIDVLGAGDPTLRDRFRVPSTTVPGLPLEDAGWEDDENRPRTAEELADALEATWSMIETNLRRWTAADLDEAFSRPGRPGEPASTRRWVVWHELEHDIHHGGEISQILGSRGLPGLDL
jgi:uncharacterized damage-inducible protein DinB